MSSSSKELDVLFLLSPFESRMLTVMNMAPSQLHPNSWAFLKTFQVLYYYLHISMTIKKIMYFYQLKHGFDVGCLFNGAQNGHFSTIYTFSFKNFTNKFFKLKYSPKAFKNDFSFTQIIHPNFLCIGKC